MYASMAMLQVSGQYTQSTYAHSLCLSLLVACCNCLSVLCAQATDDEMDLPTLWSWTDVLDT